MFIALFVMAIMGFNIKAYGESIKLPAFFDMTSSSSISWKILQEIHQERVTQAIAEFYPKYAFNEFLGRGWRGVVWGDAACDFVLKACPQKYPSLQDHITRHTNEYEIMVRVYEALKKYDPQGTLRRQASIIEPKHFHFSKTTNVCLIAMERLYPFACAENGLIRARFEDVQCYTHIGQQISKKGSQRPEKAMEELCYNFGKIFAIVQLAAHIDGHDTETYLASRSQKDTDNYRLVMLDFGSVHVIPDRLFSSGNENDLIEWLIEPFTKKHRHANPPTFTTPGFSFFRKGYLAIAAALDEEYKASFYVPLSEMLFKEIIIRTLLAKNMADFIKKCSNKRLTDTLLKNQLYCASILYNRLKHNNFYLPPTKLEAELQACCH